MMLNIIASAFIAVFALREIRFTIEMMGSPYESKGLWLLLSVGQITAYGVVAWAVWS